MSFLIGRLAFDRCFARKLGLEATSYMSAVAESSKMGSKKRGWRSTEKARAESKWIRSQNCLIYWKLKEFSVTDWNTWTARPMQLLLWPMLLDRSRVTMSSIWYSMRKSLNCCLLQQGRVRKKSELNSWTQLFLHLYCSGEFRLGSQNASSSRSLLLLACIYCNASSKLVEEGL